MGTAHSEINQVDPGAVGFDADRLARIDKGLARFVDDGTLPGWLVLVARHGKIAHLSTYGMRDVEASDPVQNDTVFRIYSMTKPITSVAAMMLYEEGLLELTDPVSDYIPAFANPEVFAGGSARVPQTRPASEPIRIWHLLTHTAGLTYGFNRLHPVDELYRLHGFEMPTPHGPSLAESCEQWAKLPLIAEPGTTFSYGISTDVLGRVIEVVSGQSLDEFFRNRILDPLGMHETGFHVTPEHQDRLASLYAANLDGTFAPSKLARGALVPPTAPSGGGGLVSTAQDYLRFLQMLQGEGTLDGVRLLGSRTFRYMTRNHLPGHEHIDRIGLGSFSEDTQAGKGFGLGFAVVEDPADAKVIATPGELSWGGLASTAFWVDPVEDLSVVFMTQLIPAHPLPIRPRLRALVYQALI